MPAPSRSLVFFGNEKLATGINSKPVVQDRLRQAGYELEAIITEKPEQLPDFKSRLAVLVAYGRLLPPAWLEKFPLGIINIHPSLLPRYRGPSPIEQAILDGVDKTGTSIMQITSEMDAGPIYKQRTLHLTGHETKQILADQLQTLGADLLLEVLPDIFDGQVKPRQQPHPDRDASYTKLIKKADGLIDWSKPADRLEREIRAYAVWPGSRAQLAGRDVIITAAHSVPDDSPGRTAGRATAAAGLIRVECGQGYLCIEKLKPAGKAEMTAKAFLAGNPLPNG